MHHTLEHELNRPQLEAALTTAGPVLIIAGAGSGKTRVITYRIAYMLEQGIPQRAILALTFTNKAAREMESRVKERTGKKLQSLTVSTFHAFGVQILRSEIEALGYRKHFSIYDESDRGELIKECLRDTRTGADGANLFALGQLFSGIKTGRFSWNNAPETAGGTGGTKLEAAAYQRVYNEYQRSLKIYNAVDFDDLLTLPIELFENHPGVLAAYRERYRYIMVDEFQDTSLVQYRLLRLLALGTDPAPGTANICVVGDDDQSIYSWRGANYENLLLLERDFPGIKEIKLEQNYRSTTTILDAANGVIANNKNRKVKKLWSPSAGGNPVELYHPDNESEEAALISAKIGEHMIQEQRGYDEFGILLRTNFLTRAIEEALLESNIPYRVSGGQSFFQRKEIKDILAYLRLIANPRDDVNLLRIINTPRRGIGKSAIAALSALAGNSTSCLWDALERVCAAPKEHSPLPPKTMADIETFKALIETHRETLLGARARGGEQGGPRGLAGHVSALVDDIEYWPYLAAEFSKNEKIARWRYSNIEYFIQSIERWENDPDTADTSLFAWLNRVSLITRDDGSDEADNGKVNVMTIHAAKGLEFPVVFIAGAEDGIMPHTRRMEEEEGTGPMEEERRLFYVALTRARDKLYITSCKTRRRLQETVECAPSPFLAEIPPHVLVTRDIEHEAAPADTEALFARIRSSFS